MKWCRYIILHLCLIGLLIELPLVGAAADSMTGNTHVDLELMPHTGEIPLVDPNDVGTTINRNDAPPSSETSANNNGLSFAYVTGGLNFGTHFINERSISPEKDGLWKDQFVIEVADGRGTHAGWTLGVSGQPFELVTPDNKAKVQAAGVTLSLLLFRIHNNSHDDLIPSGDVTEISLDNNSASHALITVPSGSGMGMTAITFDRSQIQLNVPANAVQPGEYSTGLNWSLLNVPQK